MTTAGNRGSRLRKAPREGTTRITERSAPFHCDWRLQLDRSSCSRAAAWTLSPESSGLIIMKKN